MLHQGQALGLPMVLNYIAMRPNRPGIKEVHAFAGSQGIPLRPVGLDGSMPSGFSIFMDSWKIEGCCFMPPA